MKTFKKFLAIAGIAVIVPTIAFGSGIDVPSLFHVSGTGIVPNTSSLSIGTSSERVAKIWTSDLDTTAVSIGGAIAGDLTVGGTVISGVDSTVGTPNTAGSAKLWSAGDNNYYNQITSGTNTANAMYTLPVAMPTVSGQSLTSTNAGVMSWATPSSGWGLTGNAGTVAGTNFIGTTDNVDLVLKRGGVQSGLINTSINNTFYGYEAGLTGATGGYGGNVLLGSGAGSAGTALSYAVAVGRLSLSRNTTGMFNVSIGSASLYNNIIGSGNTAIGHGSLGMALGDGNVGLGTYAGQYETGSNAFYVDNQNRTNTAGEKAGSLLYGTFNAIPANQTLHINGVIFPIQAPGASPPTYVKGGMYFNTTSNKLMIGGATGWETVTSL